MRAGKAEISAVGVAALIAGELRVRDAARIRGTGRCENVHRDGGLVRSSADF